MIPPFGIGPGYRLGIGWHSGDAVRINLKAFDSRITSATLGVEGGKPGNGETTGIVGSGHPFTAPTEMVPLVNPVAKS